MRLEHHLVGGYVRYIIPHIIIIIKTISEEIRSRRWKWLGHYAETRSRKWLQYRIDMGARRKEKAKMTKNNLAANGRKGENQGWMDIAGSGQHG